MTAQIFRFAPRHADRVVIERHEDGAMGYVRTRIQRPGIDARITLHGFVRGGFCLTSLEGEVTSRLLEDTAEALIKLHPDIAHWQAIMDHSTQTKPVSLVAILNASRRWNATINERDAGRKTLIIPKGNLHLKRYIQSLYAHKQVEFTTGRALALDQIGALPQVKDNGLNLSVDLRRDLNWPLKL